ncbi:MAG: hypothetical protein J5I81_11340 [Nitrococcus mobilis]|nr:hypothetical protein [Nitrococcus mobilis]
MNTTCTHVNHAVFDLPSRDWKTIKIERLRETLRSAGSPSACWNSTLARAASRVTSACIQT